MTFLIPFLCKEILIKGRKSRRYAVHYDRLSLRCGKLPFDLIDRNCDEVLGTRAHPLLAVPLDGSVRGRGPVPQMFRNPRV